ncbi:MAG: hypothetical protein NVSMB45_17230 [Ginsengibacter sp.]
MPIGVVHAFINPTDTIVEVYNTHEPALRMENYFEDACKAIDKVTDYRKKDFKMNLKGMIYFSTLMSRYRNEIIAKDPPDVAVKVLGFIGRFIGIKI